jgi:hypothetical protein
VATIPGADPLVEAFLAQRGDDPTPPLSRPELAKILTDLDRLYWKEVETQIEANARAHSDRLVFHKYERMLIDLGLVDIRLIPRGEEVRIQLLKDLYHRGPPHIQYFSEWIGARYRTFVLYGRLGAAGDGREASAAAPVGAEDPQLRQFREARTRIYERLRPLFQNLPGFPPQSVDLLFSGRIDASIEQLTVQMTQQEHPRIVEQWRHLNDLRARMIQRARERATTDEELMLFDGLEKIDMVLAERVAAQGATASVPKPRPEGAAGPAVAPSERVKFVQGEVRLVRQLIKLGLAGSGLTRTTSVLTGVEGRATKPQVLEVLRGVKECDPGLPGTPSIVIAPYAGSGFYEWDRDTVFIPLSPTRSVEESVVTGLANYRIMLDTLHGGGRLKRAYETRFGKQDFRGQFIRDYKNWVMGIGKGYRGAMPPERYDFFRTYIGPSVDDLFMPVEIARRTPEERTRLIAELRRKINRAEAEFEDYINLAVQYWKESRPQEALDMLAVAVKLYPVDGRALYALGHACISLGIHDKGRAALEECLNVAANTIWHVYAQDALQKHG